VSRQTSDSSIYDLGYRHYEGARIGRRGTLLTLYVHGLRSIFGLGRRTTSKIFPVALAVLAFVPAIVQLAVGAIASGFEEGVEVIEHEEYFEYVRVILVLFCATVAPELVGRDQRHRTLSLYFSRAVTRFDYAGAKLAALMSAMLVLTLGPQAVLFVGNGMVGDDLGGYLAERWDLIFPIVGGSLVVSLTIASVGLVIAGHLPRRAYATPAIVGLFVLSLSAANILMDTIDQATARYAVLVSPVAWEGVVLWLFRVEPDSGNIVSQADFPGWVYLAAVSVLVAVALAATLRRLGRVVT
jgi:ABC-2 type transport system permease protein